jgi:hypothetical protein
MIHQHAGAHNVRSWEKTSCRQTAHICLHAAFQVCEHINLESMSLGQPEGHIYTYKYKSWCCRVQSWWASRAGGAVTTAFQLGQYIIEPSGINTLFSFPSLRSLAKAKESPDWIMIWLPWFSVRRLHRRRRRGFNHVAFICYMTLHTSLLFLLMRKCFTQRVSYHHHHEAHCSRSSIESRNRFEFRDILYPSLTGSDTLAVKSTWNIVCSIAQMK